MSGRRQFDTFVIDDQASVLATGIPIDVEIRALDGTWQTVARTRTDESGGTGNLAVHDHNDYSKRVEWRLTYDATNYWESRGHDPLFPIVTVTLAVDSNDFHLVLLLGPHSYTPYRGY